MALLEEGLLGFSGPNQTQWLSLPVVLDIDVEPLATFQHFDFLYARLTPCLDDNGHKL